ncbi:unnamed protein product [Rotaria sordida]|nr:unnamed protein product [Rotaria sordida]CAF1500879.1 unnamed protein product [Rotaria sordida]CAF4101581.1 unnamed protein product [Rotaria sordida]CAF4120596.1 unnamed protein product [Rotaria sordida]CAF4165794.1 unnamed protein product [Rotaria sordida]
MINIHLLSKYPFESLSYSINQLPIDYFLLTEYEAKLFQHINKFHSNEYLSNNYQLDYSRLDSSYITPFIPFIRFYQFIYSTSQFIQNNQFYISSKYNTSILGNYIHFNTDTSFLSYR